MFLETLGNRSVLLFMVQVSQKMLPSPDARVSDRNFGARPKKHATRRHICIKQYGRSFRS